MALFPAGCRPGARMHARLCCALLLCGGAVGGFLTGCFGTGGGLIFTAVCVSLLGMPLHTALPTVAVATAVVSAAGAVFYAQGGAGLTGELPGFLLPAALGGLVGAGLLRRVSAHVLRVLFAVLLCVGGLAMLLRAIGGKIC